MHDASRKVLPFEADTDERWLQFFSDASRTLSTSLDLQRTLATIAEIAVPALADACQVDLIEDGQLTRAAVAAIDRDVLPARDPGARAVIPVDSGENRVAQASRGTAPVVLDTIADGALASLA